MEALIIAGNWIVAIAIVAILLVFAAWQTRSPSTGALTLTTWCGCHGNPALHHTASSGTCDHISNYLPAREPRRRKSLNGRFQSTPRTVWKTETFTT